MLSFDAADRDYRGAGRGGAWRRGPVVPGLLGAVVALGVRACARGARHGWDAVTQATACSLQLMRGYARAGAVLDGTAASRQLGGYRSSDASGVVRRWASSDRWAPRAATDHGPWVAACRTHACRRFAGVRDAVAGCAGPRAGGGLSNWQRDRGYGRGGHARCPGVGAALRARPRRSVGACGLAHRRTAARTWPRSALTRD